MKKYFSLYFLILFLPLASNGQSDADYIGLGKMFLEGDVLYGVFPTGLGAFDLSHKGAPEPLGFIAIEGLTDVVVRGSFVWISQYDELVCAKVDFENGSITRLNSVEGVFPNDSRPGMDKRLRAFDAKRFEEKLKDGSVFTRSDLGNPPSSGTQGSMSRLVLKGDFLYAVNEGGLGDVRRPD